MVVQNDVLGALRTHSGDNLSLHTELVGKSSSKIRNATFSISRHVRHLSDMIEHVSASKQKDSDQADSRPQIAILNDRHNVGVGDTEERNDAEEYCGDGHNAYIVYWPSDFRFPSFRLVAAYPVVNLLCG